MECSRRRPLDYGKDVFGITSDWLSRADGYINPHFTSPSLFFITQYLLYCQNDTETPRCLRGFLPLSRKHEGEQSHGFRSSALFCKIKTRIGRSHVSAFLSLIYLSKKRRTVCMSSACAGRPPFKVFHDVNYVLSRPRWMFLHQND